MSEHVAIVGGGAIGLLVAAHLASGGVRVTVLCRTEEQVQAIRTSGIVVERLDNGRPLAAAVEAASFNACEREGVRTPWAILCVKAADVAAILQAWPPGLGSEAAVALQNGLSAARELLQVLGPARALAGVTRLGANRVGPARVREGGHGDTLIGPLDPQGTERAVRMAQLLAAAGLEARMLPDARAALWWKAAINTAINPLTAVLGIANGELLMRTEWHWLMRAALVEAVDAALVDGVTLEAASLWNDVLDTLRRTGANRSSMLVDVEAGRPTELDAITGEILAAADRRGLRAHANHALYHLVRARTETRDPR